MTQPASHYRAPDDNSLIELLDRLVETGVVATGDVLLGLADVDLIRVNLQLVLGAVDTLMADDVDRSMHLPSGQQPPVAYPAQSQPARPAQSQPAHAAQSQPARVAQSQPGRGSQPPSATQRPSSHPAEPASLRLDSADRADLGVGGLLVAVIEIVHRLLERQAIHRMERGSLTSDQIERLGQALMALDQRINQLIEIFGLRSTSALPPTVAGIAH
ncbi:MAG: gas vesicle protein GvpJ [Jatrophihabitantaceae bacterium]